MMAVVALVITLVLMLVELRISMRNERVLRGRGAQASPDPAYPAMRWAYPGLFVMMAAEGLLFPPSRAWVLLAGAVLFVLGKALKLWAITSLGPRWTYRVFVLPGESLVSHGPYRWLRHPNYLAVIAELLGFALVVGARWSGIIAILGF